MYVLARIDYGTGYTDAWFDFMNILYILYHDDFIKSKHFPRYWPFVRGIHRSPVNSPHKGQWRGALTFFVTAPE